MFGAVLFYEFTAMMISWCHKFNSIDIFGHWRSIKASHIFWYSKCISLNSYDAQWHCILSIKNKCCGCCKQSSFCCNVHASYPFNNSYKLAKSSSIGHIMHRTVHINMDKLYAHTWSVQCTLSLVMVFICIKPNQGHVLLINVEYIQAIIFVWSYLHKHFVSSYCLLAGAKQLWSDIFYTSIFEDELIFSFGNRLFFARYFLQQNFYKLCLCKKNKVIIIDTNVWIFLPMNVYFTLFMEY